MIKSLRNAALIVLLASPTMPGAIQAAALDQEQPPVVTPAPPPAPVSWRLNDARELLEYVRNVGVDGLSPAAYGPDRLAAAIETGDRAQVTPVASEIFLQLATDLSGGRVRGRSRVDWFMPDAGLTEEARRQLLTQVTTRGGVAEALNGLLPTHPQYAGLKRALANTAPDDTARRDLIRTNMERWRWMPRNLGARHVLVNVPAFTAALIDEGRVTARHRAVVGAVRTPTPQLSATITAVTMNPWWNVPQSIVRTTSFGAGYQVTRGANGSISVRQPPGPRNALGRLKIEMPNPHAIYLHDTPSQALFGRAVRAFSHGCIRTQNVRDFAAHLLESTDGWNRDRIDDVIATGRNQTQRLAQPVPVYIAYFTAAATTDGDIVRYNDLYGRDTPVRVALNRAGPARTPAATATASSGGN
ncbi:MAG TPA: L,D-transpeptidase family protein [Allosphingosinicella sp.]|nr:L,D-transpeptidase family protein [Allosphingosinicella sp.]